jgi:hypothetical protein
MSVANIRMLLNIRQSRRRVEQGNTNNTGLVLQRMTPLDKMLFYMMLINVSSFIVTQTPFHIYTVVQSISKLFGSYALVRAMLLILSSIYFGVGSYLYYLASPRFRETFVALMKKMICCQVHQRRE